MSTIINTPSAPSDSSGTGLVVGILIALVAAGLFFVYMLPQIRSANSTPTDTTIKVELPNPTTPSTPATTPPKTQ